MSPQCRVYISGPMTGYEDFNYPAFHECAAALRSSPDGYWIVANPAEFHDGDQSLPRSEYFREDVEVLLSTQAIVLLDGWPKSQGARFEIAVALQIGVTEFFLFHPGPNWHLEPVPVAHMRAVLAHYQMATPEPEPLGDPVEAYTTAEEVTAWAMPQRDESALIDAHVLVHGDRGDAYGHPLDDFTKTATIWSAIFGHEVTAEEVALAMIGVKMSRLLNTPGHRDSIVDVAGYAETYDMVRSERERRAADPLERPRRAS